MTDLEIAQQATMKPIKDIAAQIGLGEDDIEPYGKYKAKISTKFEHGTPDPNHKLILVTSINPTPAGEGKSTVLVGLGDALSSLDKKTIIAIREPSMGPVMGMKGGATGGGYSQVMPMEDINLHFTGDMSALTSANNTLAALIDNYIQRDNELDLDPKRIIWKRVLDINDRALRNTITGLGGISQGVPRETGFDITAASELMAILCLATSIADLKTRISRIVVGYSSKREPITVGQLGFEDAITILLKDAIKPNLAQTLAHTPAIIHGGPFANIAHGCNSVAATMTGLNLADYTVTESGFGSDLGAEKFLDIKAPQLGKTPNAVVIVATVRALKYNGGQAKDALQEENLDALKTGMPNLLRHIANIKRYGLPVVVAINHFVSDTQAELDLIKKAVEADDTTAVITDSWAKGGEGTVALAEEVIKAADTDTTFNKLYDNKDSIEDKLNAVVTNVYGGRKAILSKKAARQAKQFTDLGWGNLPICIAKTQYSLSDDPKLLGAPTDFDIDVRELVPKIGAGFIVALTGNILTMPGLPKVPAAVNMHIDDDGKIEGLF
ncbi:formate--tetrahydrofolate ligase [Paucilactobacillus suebicus]|uniref:Formate--tetrahydrofolate ligase n=1 Tax=Paucilactobacillus suebicus DSM 5007 = KCTC 3549 TaxID=1423807 RepID=A0A0R1VVZ0_9LACO|nr:formate--tetrahydrofolate ligase [Paucilactobacillus suebicus]KRM09666.1 formate--tetrahydrofolate ligase [Paucilactobacillus suebicus DSM 5007 = KCTC 3549]